jgi:arylsulfatase
VILLSIAVTSAAPAQDKPNILVIWGDDIGQTNVSACSRGMMGYQTPNIDRIAKEGMMFTDYYGEQSCTAAALDFIERQTKAGKPWFCWWSDARMHFRTHVSQERMAEAKKVCPNADEYTAGMIEHDMHIGKFLDLLDQLGIADNTIVHYSTDNGPHYNTWPDAAATPFRGEKNTNWEGGWRVPCAVRWPGLIKPGSVSNGIVHHMDWLPTFLAAGRKDIKEDLLDGYRSRALGRNYKVHLDGYDLTEHLRNPQDVPSPRKEIFYFSDDGDLTALRYQDWKLIFMEQRVEATLQAWAEPFVRLRVPLIFNLRRDPYERAQLTSNTYHDWLTDRAYLLVPAQTYVGAFLKTFQEYPPRQKAASFTLDQVMDELVPPTQ